MKNKLNSFSKFAMTAACCLVLAGCASSRQMSGEDVYDPFESMNRTTFSINDAMDQAILEPVAKGYRAVAPQPVRDGVRNVLRNLKTPVNAANQLLQGDVEGFAGDITRGLINTVLGVGGIFDVAETAGIPYESEDFGQTLAVWGVGHGPYLVLPLMGPSSFRDATGLLVDAYADPLRIYLHNTDQNEWQYVRLGFTALEKRESVIDALDDLRKNSLDYYAAMRSAYMQYRAALVRDENPDEAAAPAIPDYDDETLDE